MINAQEQTKKHSETKTHDKMPIKLWTASQNTYGSLNTNTSDQSNETHRNANLTAEKLSGILHDGLNTFRFVELLLSVTFYICSNRPLAFYSKVAEEMLPSLCAEFAANP